MSMSRWRNVRSDVNRAIRLSGLSVNTAPEEVPLTGDWEAVAQLAPDRTLRSVLRRFGRYCCSLQLAPEDVGDETVRRFAAYLDLNQLSKTPKRTIKDVIRTWNNHVACDPTGRFSPLTTQTLKRSYTMSWEELPKGLFADARAYKDASVDQSYFDDGEYKKPVRPSTAAQRDRMLRRLASAEILSGVDPAALQSLADIVEPERLKPALEFFVKRNGGEPAHRRVSNYDPRRHICPLLLRQSAGGLDRGPGPFVPNPDRGRGLVADRGLLGCGHQRCHDTAARIPEDAGGRPGRPFQHGHRRGPRSPVA
jgi:hypothetical protein